MKKFLLFIILSPFCLLTSLSFGSECIEGNCINGQGTLVAPNGEKYSGEFKDGVKQGQGVYTFPNGEVYIGAFDKGKPNGRGVHTYPTGQRYEGEFKNSLYHGKGTQTFPDGREYVGEFSNGNANGTGTLTLANGEKYIGGFANGKGNGQGKYTFPNGTIYEGEFKDFVYHGNGRIIFSDGSKYVGEFRDGLRNGNGVITFSDGEKYMGGWKDDKKHGFGMLITSAGEEYKGTWNEDKFVRYSDGYIPPEDSYTYPGERAKKHITDKEPKDSSGTAFFINKNGYMVTNHHVISDCKRIQINNSEIDSTASIVVTDEINDLGIIISDKSYAQYAKLRGGKGARVGADIITVGYPLGPILGETIKVTTGNISAATGIANDTSIMQISAPIQPGSSGGPVLDMSGNVVGVVVTLP